jgi:hypothetical protein
MHKIFAVDVAYIGYTQIPVFAAFILAGVFVHRLINYWGELRLIRWSLRLLLLAGLLLILLNTGYWPYHSVFYIFPMSLYLAGFALAGSPLVNQAMASIGNKGVAAGLLGLFMALVAAVASMLTGYLESAIILPIACLIAAFPACAAIFYLSYFFMEYK